MNPTVLFEDNHLFIVSKPAGWLSQSDRTGDTTVVAWAKNYRRTRENKPGDAYIGLTHRLDRPTSGVLVLAKTSKAAARISKQFAQRQVRKWYWACIEMEPSGRNVLAELNSGALVRWEDYLRKDTASGRVQRVAAGSGDFAATEVRCLAQRGDRALLELLPRTGRSHQLRVQLATRGLPIIGDRRYRPRPPGEPPCPLGPRSIALHALRIAFLHPTTQIEVDITAPLPQSWRHLGVEDRGDFVQESP